MPRTMTSPRGISKTAAVEKFVGQAALVIQVDVAFADGVNSRGLAGLGQRTNGAFMGCTVMGIQVQHILTPSGRNKIGVLLQRCSNIQRIHSLHYGYYSTRKLIIQYNYRESAV